MADYLKLFLAERLNMEDHAEYIKSRLAVMSVEDPLGYKRYSEFYGVEVKVVAGKLPKVVKPGKTEVAKKKRGRPAKS